MATGGRGAVSGNLPGHTPQLPPELSLHEAETAVLPADVLEEAQGLVP